MSKQLLTVLQLSDSAFPTGGFSHSAGLEAAYQHNLINTREELHKVVIGCLENAGSTSLPFVVESHKFCDNIVKLIELDRHCETCLNNHVANRASKRQGNSLVGSAANTFQHSDDIQALQKAVEDSRLVGHQAVVFGAVYGSLNIDLDTTLTTFMFSTLKTVVSSLVRLGRLGPMEAQKLQYDWKECIPEIITRNRDLNIDDVHTAHPLVDLLQNTQDTMFSKLFYS